MVPAVKGDKLLISIIIPIVLVTGTPNNLQAVTDFSGARPFLDRISGISKLFSDVFVFASLSSISEMRALDTCNTCFSSFFYCYKRFSDVGEHVMDVKACSNNFVCHFFYFNNSNIS